MSNTEFSLNQIDIQKALKDGLQGALTVAITAGTYLIGHPELLGPTTAWTTAALAVLPLVVSLLSRWAVPSSSVSPTPATAQETK